MAYGAILERLCTATYRRFESCHFRVSVTEVINANYDRNILAFICVATAVVMLLIGALVLTTDVGVQWFLLPASWWVGGMMVWGYGKFLRRR